MPKILSIEIGTALTRLCTVDYKAKTPKVYKAATIPTPPGLISDGELSQNEAFTVLLRDTIASKGMRCKQVIFNVFSTKIATREVSIPAVKPARIGSLIAANASDYFPINLEQYSLGHILLGGAQEGENAKMRVMALAAPRTLVVGYRKLAEALGMQIVGIDYAGNGIFQLTKDVCRQGLNVVIKVDDRSTLLSILDKGAVVLQRSVNYGVADGLSAMVEDASLGVADLGQAWNMARAQCMLELPAAAEFPAKPKDMVTASFDMLINGIVRILDYYSSRGQNVTFDRMLLTGLGAEFRGLDELLTKELGQRVEILAPAPGSTMAKLFKSGGYGEYAGAIGAAIDPVGFLDDEIVSVKVKAAQEAQLARAISIGVLAVGIAASLAMAGISSYRLGKVGVEVAAAGQRMAELEEARLAYNKFVEVQNDYIHAATIYSATQNAHMYLPELISLLESQLPSGAYLESFNSSLTTLDLSFKTSTKQEAAMVLQQMRAFPMLENITINGLQHNPDSDTAQGEVSFSISATYKPVETKLNTLEQQMAELGLAQ